MTNEVPDWASADVPWAPVHQEHQDPLTRPFTQQELQEFGKQFIEQFLRRVVLAVAGSFLPNEAAFDQLQQWAQNIPFVGDIINFIKTTTGIDLSSPQALITSLGNLIAVGGKLPSIFSISRIGNIIQDLINGAGAFLNADSVSPGSPWSWDSVMPGWKSGGSIRATANGTQQVLRADEVFEVFEGQTLKIKDAASRWTGATATAGSNPIKVGWTPYDADGNAMADVIKGTLQPSGDSAGWVPFTVSDWTVPAGVSHATTLIILDSGATAGNVWVSNVLPYAAQLLDTDLVRGLTAALQTFRDLLDAVGGVVGSTVTEIEARLSAIAADGKIDAAELTNLSNSVIQTLKDTIGGTIGAGWTDIQNRLSGLNPLGQLNVAKLLGQLPHGQVTSPVGGTSLGGDLGKMLDGFWNTVFGTSASGKNTDDFITATGALKQTADDAMAAAIYASDLINLPRRSPRWMSTGTHDDVSFPIVNASTTFTPALGKLVLIPVTPDVARLYKAVKVGITATGMTSLYVGLYRIDSGGNIVLDTSLGNVKSSVTASKIQTFAIPAPYFAVDRGETVFIGALQVGGTAAPILTNNAMLSVLESVQPVPLYFAQDGGSSLSSLPSTVGVSVELSPAWGALGEVHLVSSWLDFTTPSVDPATWVFPSTARYLDLVVCTAGGGGGGGDGGWNKPGEGGKPGVWLGRRVERGVDIPWGITQLKYWVQVVGKGAAGKETDGWQGGGFTSIGPGADQPLWFYTDPSTNLRVNLIVGKGGTGGRLAYGNFNNWDPVGYGPGNFAFGGRLFIGGANTATPPSSGAGRGYNGNLPGGGGSGGSGGTGGNAGGGGDGGPGFAAARAT